MGPSPPAAVVRPAAPARTARLARALGSLRLAVCLLPVFAGVLFLGTLLESWHDRQVAAQLVYQTWWFAALLGLLGMNIFFAAAKKWPWKRHQTGFLITHTGLLTLVAGGLIDGLAGTAGVLVLVDSDDAAAVRQGPHTTGRLLDRTAQVIRVHKPGESDVFEAAFDPGPLAWSTTEVLPRRVDRLTAFLAALARPLPAGWARDLEDGARLEVLAYFPHTRVEAFRPTTDASGFPAVRVQMVSATTGLLPPEWVAYHSGRRASRRGAGLIEMLAHGCRPEQLAEFLHPPQPDQLGGKGQLVLGLAGKTYRFDVDRLGGSPRTLGDSSWTVSLLQYLPDFQHPAEMVPVNPAVTFALSTADGRQAAFATAARQAGELAAVRSAGPLPAGLGDFWAWYHPPDYRYGDSSLRGLLQLAAAADGRLSYRSMHTAGVAGCVLEKSGSAAKEAGWQPVWGAMGWRFEVVEYLPSAAPGPHFVPVDRGLGVEDGATTAALHCRLTQGVAAEEFWLGKTEEGFLPVAVGGTRFQVGYHPAVRDLGFELTLLRAEQPMDKGTPNPAGQTSFVAVHDPPGSTPGPAHCIRLNEPLVYRGYKIYQNGFQALGRDENGKPYNRATFLVNRDPGLYVKYTGSVLLALGIAVMFYMRAYFFKPRGRPAGELAPEA
jgi:hypothetical protein